MSGPTKHAAMLDVKLRFFASLREALGPDGAVRVPAGSTVGDLRDALIEGGDPGAKVLARGRAVRCAVNQVLCPESTLLTDDCEVAFFPPVTGG